MSSQLRSMISSEAIAFQSGRLFQDLTEAFHKLRKEGKYTSDSIKECGFTEITMAHTNLRTVLIIDPDGDHAQINWPPIDVNHPFFKEIHKGFSNSDTGLTLIRNMGGSITGSVDLKNCKVHGVFTTIQGDIRFGVELVKNRRYTDGELAAIYLHECGHIFTYFEYLGSVAMTSHVMAAAVKSLNNIDDYDTRVKVLKEAERVIGIEIHDRERIANMPVKARGVAAETVMITAVAEKSRSETGNNIYELRSVEQLADQFAARHGAGRDLVTALDKLFKNYAHQSTMNTTEHTMMEIIKFIIFCGSAVLLPITTVVWLLFSNPTRKIYDDPQARVRLVRQMLTEELKYPKLDPKRRKMLLEDMEAIRIVEAGLDDKRTLLEMFWTTVMPTGRVAIRQEEAQKRIEALLNNELFEMSARFKVGQESMSFLKKAAVGGAFAVLLFLIHRLFGGAGSGGSGGGGSGSSTPPSSGTLANELNAAHEEHKPKTQAACEEIDKAVQDFPQTVSRIASELTQHAEDTRRAAKVSRDDATATAATAAAEQAARDAEARAETLRRRQDNTPTKEVSDMVRRELSSFIQPEDAEMCAISLSEIKFFFSGSSHGCPYQAAYVQHALRGITCLLTEKEQGVVRFKQELTRVLMVLHGSCYKRLQVAGDVLAVIRERRPNTEIPKLLSTLPDDDVGTLRPLSKVFNDCFEQTSTRKVDVLGPKSPREMSDVFVKICSVAAMNTGRSHTMAYSSIQNNLKDAYSGFDNIEPIWKEALDIQNLLASKGEAMALAYQKEAELVMSTGHEHAIHENAVILKNYLAGCAVLVNKFAGGRGIAHARQHVNDAYTHTSAFLDKLKKALKNPV